MTYNTIVVDPPWPQQLGIKCGGYHDGHKTASRRQQQKDARQRYKTMTLNEIKKLHLPHNVDANLFVWTTQTMLPFTFDIIESWDATYTCTIPWDKHRGTNSWHIYRNTEFLIYAYWGSREETLPLKTIPCLLDVPAKGRHSEKPASIYRKIVTWTKPPRLDMFARRRHMGFDVYGDQVENLPHVQEVLCDG